MHTQTIHAISHDHNFDDTANSANEKKTLRVIILTLITMVAEIVTGTLTGSMALLADGWHMGTHTFALGITYFAYIMARRLASSPNYGFGTGKFGILSGYTSAIFLGATAIIMIIESIDRIINPVNIAFNEAIIVAVIGLIVNILSVWMLQGSGADGHSHNHHTHSHSSDKPHVHHDHNLRAAYLHVLADALTSVLAISALFAGKYLGWSFLDPVIGIAGGIVIGKWAIGLLKSSGRLLLDGNDNEEINKQVITAIESDGDSIVSDLHIWPISSDALAAAITIISKENRSATEYTTRLNNITRLKHTTIETHLCTDATCKCKQ